MLRRYAEKILSEWVGFFSVNALADQTGLRDKSVDFITAAQAAHWFDRMQFQRECRRILKHGGKTALIWNIRDNEHDMIKRDYAIREKYAMDRKGLGDAGGPWTGISDFFSNESCEVKIFRNDLVFDRENYIGRNLSASYAPRIETDPQKYHGFVCELNELFDKYNVSGNLRFPHFTQSFAGSV